MKRYLWVTALLLAAVPVFAQDPDEAARRDPAAGALFADGNLALRQLQRDNDPVQQLKRFFAEAKMPLSSTQERELNNIVDAQVKAIEAAGQDEDAVRKANIEFTRKSSEVLTADQRTELRRYRTEQIMIRGGFPALKLTLDNAGAPLTPDQETQAKGLYDDLNRQIAQLKSDVNAPADRAQRDKLESAALGAVVRLLTPEQRKALAASRQGRFLSKVRP